jgi:hypothetical protein
MEKIMPLTPPEITLEINSGSLTIRTAEAIYHVLVTGDAPASPALPAVAAPSLPPAQESNAETEYYANLSADIFNEIGKLARSLSDLAPKAAAASSSISASQELGNRLKAIIAEAKAMAQAAQASPGAEASAPNSQDAMEPLTAFLQSLAGEPLADCLAAAGRLTEALQSAAAAPPPAAPAAVANAAYDFPLELVFQTMYELCTNEAVKKHIKAMWDSAEQTFDPGKLEAELNQAAAECGGPDEDNFLNLSLKEVLKSMSRATPKDNFQQILKKMASTSEQIFLEQTLPIEAIPKPDSAAPAPPAGGGAASLLGLAQSLLSSLQAKAQALVPPALPPLAAAPTPAAAIDLGPLAACLDEIAAGIDSLLASGAAVTPDLSRMLAETQSKLLSLAVNINARLRRQDAAAAGQAAAPALTGGGHDPEAVNDLLRALGF